MEIAAFVEITVEGRRPFYCDVGWTTERAILKIRDDYRVQGGGIRRMINGGFRITVDDDVQITAEHVYIFDNFTDSESEFV